MKDLISVVVPVYNSQNYLHKCVDSLLKQSYKNIEIILIDDGSTDGSDKICDDFAKKDNRIKIVHKSNAGVSSARNTGIKLASGKYITFVDSDDYVSEDYIKNMYYKIDDCIIICENSIDFGENFLYKNDFIKKDMVLSKKDFIIEILKENLINGVCWGKLYITNIAKNNLFNSEYRIAEDLDFNIRYLEEIDGNCKIINNTEYFYFINEGSVIHSSFSDKWFDEIEVCKNLINRYINTDIYIYSVKRFFRVNLFCLTHFKLSISGVQIIKSNIREYKKDYIQSKYISLKDKIKFFIMFYFYKVILLFRKGRKR